MSATKSMSTVSNKVYIMDTSVSPHIAIPADQLKGFSPIGGALKKIDKSNMDSVSADEYTPGRMAPSEASGELILDLTNANQKKLFKLLKAMAAGTAANSTFYVGGADAASPPTVVAGVLTPAQSASPKKWLRTGILQDCYIAKWSDKRVDNDIVRVDISFQGSGLPVYSVKGEAIALTY